MKREDEPYVNPLLVDAFGNKTKRRIRQQRYKSSPSTHAKKQFSKKSQGIVSTPRVDISDRRRTLTIIAALVIVGIVILWRPITDQITLASADPKMVQLANDAGMSRKGEVLFLRTKPQLDSDTQILNDCPALAKAINGNGGILQGCYDPTNNRIYLREMPSDLYNLEVVTAAYEMLHPVYLSLSKNSQPQLNQLIESNYSSETANNGNQDLVNNITSLVVAEPGYKDLELFSLLRTQFSDLTSDLSAYYAPYFTNVTNTVSAYQSGQGLFNNDQAQLNNLNTKINNDANSAQTDYNDANTAYYDSTTWAAVGNQYQDDYNYNIYVQDFSLYKSAIANENTAIDSYNQLLQTYNTLVGEYNGTQPFNQIQNVQTQPSH